jgi:hypothetical protein
MLPATIRRAAPATVPAKAAATRLIDCSCFGFSIGGTVVPEMRIGLAEFKNAICLIQGTLTPLRLFSDR